MMESEKFKKLLEYIATVLGGKEIPVQTIESKHIGIFRIYLQ